MGVYRSVNACGTRFGMIQAMFLRNENGKPFIAAGARVAKSVARFALAACVLLLVSVFPCAHVAAGQSPSPTPVAASDPASAKAVTTEQTVQQDAAAATQKRDDAGAPAQQKDDKGKKKGEKRGSIIIAPIPVSSPAFGSGLLLIFGYV